MSAIISLLQKVPEYIVHAFPKTKQDIALYGATQAGIFTLGALANFDPAFIATHFFSTFAAALYQPSKHASKTLRKYYGITTNIPKKNVDWGVGALTGGLASYWLYQVFHKSPYESIEDIDTVAEIAKTGLVFVAATEFSRAVYSSGTFIKQLFSQPKYSYKNQLLHSMGVDTASKEASFLDVANKLKKEPHQSLAKLVKELYDDNFESFDIDNEIFQERFFYWTWKDAPVAYVYSSFGFLYPEFNQEFFDKAVEQTKKENNLSFLAVLGLHAYKKYGDDSLFHETLEALEEETNLLEQPIPGGTKKQPLTVGYTKEKEALRMIFLQKKSSDKKELEDRITMTSMLSEKHPEHISPILHHGYDEKKDTYFSTELRIRGPLLHDIIAKDTSYFHTLLSLTQNFRSTLEESSLEFEEVNQEEKYLERPLLVRKNYVRKIREAQQIFSELPSEIILDPHTKNYALKDGMIIGFDFENKGKQPVLLDYSTLFDYAADTFSSAKQLILLKQQAMNSLLSSYKISQADMDELSLYASMLRRDSFLLARPGENTPEIQQQFNYYRAYFSYMMENTSQTTLATDMLKDTQILKNSL